jgi:putative endonuclease
LARALAWQARGGRFESDILHTQKPKQSLGFFIFTAMYYTYIIYSATLNKYYVGSCQNVEERLLDHLNSRSKYTKVAKDWELKHFETFLSRSEACKRELQIKKMKSRKYIENLIESKK